MKKVDELDDTKVLDELADLEKEKEEEVKNLVNKFPQDEDFESNPFEDKDDSELPDDLEEEVKEEKKRKKEKKKDKKKEKKKRSLKEWLLSLNKKQRILLITTLVLVLILIVVIIVLILKNKKVEVEEVPYVPEVVIRLDNYRYEDGTLYILNENDEEIGKYECENKDENLCFVAIESDEDDFDVTQVVDTDGESLYTRSDTYEDRYVFISDNEEGATELVKLYDLQEENTIDTYQLFKSFGDYIIIENESSEYGLFTIGSNGLNTVIDFDYDYLGIANEVGDDVTRIVAQDSGSWSLIDLSGNKVTANLAYQIKGFNSSYVKVVNLSGDYMVYDYQGKLVNDEAYDYIKLLDSYVVFVKDSQVYVRDYSDNRMNAAGITLYNTQYLNKVIYDKDTETKTYVKSFDTEIVYDTLNVNVYETDGQTLYETTYINLLEGKLNQSIEYLEYFDGILYFYSDTDKDVLLGSYACSNYNEVTSDTTELTNCRIATDTKYEDNEMELSRTMNYGTIPIINSNYVFIYDSPTNPTDSTIKTVLYDLAANKTLGTYKTVNTYSNIEGNSVSFLDTNELIVVALNQKGMYGMIKIESSKASGILGFNFISLERIGNNYVGLETVDDVNVYRLYDSTGQLLAGDYPGKVVDYNNNYVKVFMNNLYYLYDYSGQIIEDANTAFEYIALYDNMFVYVVDNTLHARTYTSAVELIGTDGVELRISDYYNATPLAFIITFTSSTTFTIDLGTTTGTYVSTGVEYTIG